MGLGQARGSIVIDVKSVEDANRRVAQLSQGMTQSLNAIGLGTGIVLAKQLGEITFQLAESAAQAQRTRASFDALAANAGQSADAMMADMQAAGKGMITTADLVLAANRAMLLGVADSGEELAQMLNAARVLGQAMGQDVGKSFNDLVLGLGRLSPLILDNLGIANEGEKMFENYAKSIGRTADSLTKAEKKQILLNQVMAAAQPLLDAEAAGGGSAADKFEQLGVQIDEAKMELGEFLLEAGAVDALDTLATSISDTAVQLERLDFWLNGLKEAFSGFGESTGLAAYLAEVNAELDIIRNAMAALGIAIGTRAEGPRFNAAGPSSGGSIGGGAVGGYQSPAGPSAADVGATVDAAKLLDAQMDFTRDMGEINTNSNRDIQDATEQYGRQRADTIRQYELGIARDAEDFGRQRARAEKDFADSIVDIREDAGRREADAIEDLARTIGQARANAEESIADARADTNKQLVELEEKYNEDRQRAAEDHRDKMMDAAGNLDAKAVYEEQRNYARASHEAEEAHTEQRTELNEALAERIADEQKALGKSISQAQEAHDRQLADAREADERRIEDMQEDFAERKALEDEDRALRLERAAADHQAALDRQAEEHGRNIQQISDNAAEARAALQASYDEQLLDLGLHNIAYEAERRRLEKQALEDLKPFMEGWFRTAKEAMDATFPNHPSNADPYANQPDYGILLPPANPQSSGGVSASSTTTTSRTVIVHPGAIIIYGDGLNEQQVGEVMIRMFEEQVD